MTKKMVSSSRTAKKKVPPSKSKKAAVPVQAIPASFGFEQLITNLSKENGGCLPNVGFDSAGLNAFGNAMPNSFSSQTCPNNVTLITIAPRFAFAYWNIQAALMIEIANKIGSDARLTLRFYDVTETQDIQNSLYWDIEVFDRQGNWYLKLQRPEQKLYLEIGMKNRTNGFSRISGADIMHMPDEVIARPGPLKWIVIRAEGQEYSDVDQDLLKKVLGPYFYDLLMRGRFSSIADSSIEALFHEINSLRPDK